MRTEGYKLIGRKDDDYYFVDSIFDHGNGHRGCTGVIVRPVSPGEYEWATDREKVAERLVSCYEDMYGIDWDDDSEAFEVYVDASIDSEGVNAIMFDTSFNSETSAQFTKLGIEHDCTDCSGCGRIFDAGSVWDDWDELFDLDAWLTVTDFEGGKGSYEQAAKVIFGE